MESLTASVCHWRHGEKLKSGDDVQPRVMDDDFYITKYHID